MTTTVGRVALSVVADVGSSAYAGIAIDLRNIADLLDEVGRSLPNPENPADRLRLMIGMPSPSSVHQVAAVMGEPADEPVPGSGHVRADVNVGQVDLSFYHVPHAQVTAQLQRIIAATEVQ